jgi:hypothetical protein
MPVCLAGSVLYLVSERQQPWGYFAVACLGSQAAQFNDLVLNQAQPLNVANHEGRFQPTLRFSADILPRFSFSS